MKYTFGQHVTYKALDDMDYPAVVLGPYNIPQQGDYSIAYVPCNNETVVTHCWADRLTPIATNARKEIMSIITELLLRERKRAMGIAHRAMEEHLEKHEKLKSVGNRLAFIEEELANECRIIANEISGGDALDIAQGETMRDRVEKQYGITT